MKQLFISDLHLDETRQNLTLEFFRFLSDLGSRADEIYILGDFFEVWLGDDDQSKFNQSIIDALASLEAKIYLMHGNRDFLLGDSFCKAAKVTLLPEYTTINTPAGPALLLHGDSLCTLDTDYMAARRTLRSDAFQVDFLAKPMAERAEIARKLRGESMEHTQETAVDIMDVTPDEVVKAMNNANVNLLIHGHTHRPAIHEVGLGDRTGWRYVLGDWQDSMQYLVIENEQPELKLYRFT
ncbi:MAG: UDP-2,3-diacylglucosamine diphosphatase [Gammaproteobacteria bacterium]|jgi:UDP-2,3-diacylglucosamine hydrolase|nr:UDP-2,3-diacylglucosamine diphosphatase [Gammaproteobacteria bacterium]MBT4493725.1 UDP-2,3-diacylglucosamine diphosphatase [Gammaproteobacteria bacterium]MBT7369966.1 UDP-2,3-diacylglucosamine diphosphatase [Gammaproteobacteria bacterium]